MHFSWLKMLIPGNNVPESNEHPLVASCLLSQLALSPDDPTTPLHQRSDFLPFLCESNVCLFYKYPWSLQHTSSQALSWPLSLSKQPDSPKNFSSNRRFSKKTSLEPKKFYQKPLPPPASLTQWVASRNWVSTARPTQQPALLVGAPCTSHIRPKLSLNNLDNMLSKNQTK